MAGTIRPSTLYKNLGGFVTELLEWDVKTPKLRVLILPGNPGCGFYYREYAAALFSQLGGQARVTVLSHLGHSLLNTKQAGTFSLSDQICQQKRLVMNEAPEVGCGGPPLVVIGHSIGAHMALELMRQLPGQVEGVIGLFPFLEFNPSNRRQSTLSFLVKQQWYVKLIETAAVAISWLPPPLQGMIFQSQMKGDFSADAAVTTRKCMTQAVVVRNAHHMAHTEFVDLNQEPNYTFLNQAAGKIKLLFTEEDDWGPPAFMHKLQQKVPKLQCDMSDLDEKISHAFCTSTAQSLSVASTTAKYLKQMLSEFDERAKLTVVKSHDDIIKEVEEQIWASKALKEQHKKQQEELAKTTYAAAVKSAASEDESSAVLDTSAVEGVNEERGGDAEPEKKQEARTFIGSVEQTSERNKVLAVNREALAKWEQTVKVAEAQPFVQLDTVGAILKEAEVKAAGMMVGESAEQASNGTQSSQKGNSNGTEPTKSKASSKKKKSNKKKK